MALKIMDESRLANIDNSIKALEYAIKHGAQISSNSYGGQGNVLCQHYLATLKDVLSNAPNHLFVAAAGNVAGNNDDVGSCPCNANVPNAICVAATTKEKNMWKYSNYGPKDVHVFAPGENIASLWKIHGQAEHEYALANGTSMATPFVSGLAALILSLKNEISGANVKELIMNNVQELSDFQKGFVNSGGLIDVAKTLDSTLRGEGNFRGSYSDSMQNFSHSSPYKHIPTYYLVFYVISF